MSHWSQADAPDQTGKVAIVTGANSGIGLEVAQMLAAKNALVVLACRSSQRAEEAAQRIARAVPTAKLEIRSLDLSALSSVRAFATQLLERHTHVDLLINNAGVMALPYSRTADGFEMQFGTNHLGQFALTALLLPLLERAPAPRVVSVSSTMHRVGRLQLDDLQSEKSYRKWPAYGRSKLANLLFIYELERRLRAAKKKTIAVACHPGYASTNLLMVGPSLEKASWVSAFLKVANRFVAQSAERGALPTLYAATEPSLKGGEFIGPSGLFELWGAPRVVSSNAHSKDEKTAHALWELSEKLTHTGFNLS